MARYLVTYRYLENGYLELPCNWVKDGLCGVDVRPCDIKLLKEEG